MLRLRAGLGSCLLLVTACSFDGTIIDPVGGSGAQGGGEATSSGGAGAGGAAPETGGNGGDGPAGGGGATGCASDPDCYDDDPCSLNTCDGTSCVEMPIEVGAPGIVAEGCVGVCQPDGTCGLALYSKPFGSTTTPWTRVALSEAWTGANAPPPRDILAAERTVDQDVLLVATADGMLYRRIEGVWQTKIPLLSVFPDDPDDKMGVVFDPTKIYALAAWHSQPNMATAHTLQFLATGPGTTQYFFFFDLAFNGAVTIGASGVVPFEDENDAPPQTAQPSLFAMAEQSAYLGTEGWVKVWTQYGDSAYTFNGGSASPTEQWTRWTPAATSPFFMPTDSGPVPSTVVAAYKAANTQYLIAP